VTAERVDPAAAGVPSGAPAARAVPGTRRWEPEYLLSLFLLAFGALVVYEATQIPPDLAQRGSVGPKAIPTAVGIGLLVIAVFHALDVRRGGRGEAEVGEDIDLDHPADWKVVAALAGGFLANILLIERIGWPLSGALLFFVSARALGSRHLLRDVAISLVLSFGSYSVFADVLGIALPAGVLEGFL